MPVDRVMQPTETDHPTTAHLDESQRYRILASDRRRLALDALAERESPVSVEGLAVQIVDDDSEEEFDRVVVALHHVHLPMLADAGVVDYVPETRTVSPTG